MTLLPPAKHLAGLGTWAMVLAVIWCWCSSWEVTLLQQLQWESSVESVIQRPVLDLRCFTCGFPERRHSQGYNNIMDSFSVNNKILILIISSWYLMTIGGRGAERSSIYKMLCSCCNRWQTSRDSRSSGMRLTVRKLRWCAIRNRKRGENMVPTSDASLIFFPCITFLLECVGMLYKISSSWQFLQSTHQGLDFWPQLGWTDATYQWIIF